MNTVKINNEVGLTYPDGFSEMGAEELTRYFSSSENRWGAFNAEEHIILSVSWAKAGFMADADTMMIKKESRLCRSLLNYQRIQSFKTKIASKKSNARGVRFEYRVNDAKLVQVADLIIFKYKKNFYTITFITRKTNAGSSRRDFEEVLKSITLG